MVYKVVYSITGSIEVEGKSPDQAVSHMRANMMPEAVGCLDINSLDIKSVSPEEPAPEEIQNDISDYIRKAI